MASNETKFILTAEDRTAAALNSVTRGLQGITGVAGAAASSLAAIGVSFSGAAAVAMIKGTIDAADGFNDLAQKVGIGVKELAGWTLAANQSGTSMETVAKGVKSLSTYMVEHSDRLKAAGITATDANGALTQIADIFAGMPDGVEKTALAVEVFGKAGMDMIPMLNQGSAGLADAQKKAEAYGAKLAELAPLADEFNDQLAEMALHSKAAGVNITSYFMPGLVGVSHWLNDIASGGKKAWNALAWVVGGLPEGVTLGDEPAAAGGAPAVTGSASARAKALGGNGPKTSRSGGTSRASRGILGPDDVFYNIEEAVRKQNRQAIIEEQRRQDAIEERAAAMDAAHEARMEQQRIEMEGEGAIQAWIDKGTESLKEQKSVADELGLTFASAFEDAIIGGKKFSDVLKGLGDDILRVMLRKTVTEPLGNMASKFFEGFNPFGLQPNAAGGVYDSPSLSAYSGGVYDTPKLFAFANGAGVFGEAGPEAIMPLRRGADGKLGVAGGGTTVIINNYSSAKTTQTERTGSNGARELVVMIEDVVTGMMGAGALDGAMRQNFGARRQGVLRG